MFVIIFAFANESFADAIMDCSDNAKTTKASLNAPIQTFEISASIPVGTIMAFPASMNFDKLDKYKWLECNGQSVDKNTYPHLYALIGSKTPNLNEVFLRGGTSANMTVVEDTIRDHKLFIPYHTHDFQGKVTTKTMQRVDSSSKEYSFDFSDSNVSTVTTEDTHVTMDDLTNITYTKPWISATQNGSELPELAYHRSYENGDLEGGYNHASQDSLDIRDSEFVDSYKRECTGTYYTKGDGEYKYTGCAETQTTTVCTGGSGEGDSCSDVTTCVKKTYCKWGAWKYSGDYEETAPSQTAVFFERSYDGQLYGIYGEDSDPVARQTLKSSQLYGTIAGVTEDSNASITINGKKVYGDSDVNEEKYIKNKGKLITYDYKGNEITDGKMKGWYVSSTDKSGATSRNKKTGYDTTGEKTETAPQHFYVRYFIRAEP